MNAEPNHLEAWLTTAEVCARLGISESTLDRQVRGDRWQVRLRPRPGKKPERVFAPHEVEARTPKPVTEVVNDPSNSVSLTGLQSRPQIPQIPQLDAWSAIGARLLEAMAARPAAPAPEPAPTLFCTLPEASAISGLSVPCLKRLIASGDLRAIRDRAFKVRREDLKSVKGSDGIAEIDDAIAKARAAS
jgi:hypothetical protein